MRFEEPKSSTARGRGEGAGAFGDPPCPRSCVCPSLALLSVQDKLWFLYTAPFFLERLNEFAQPWGSPARSSCSHRLWAQTVPQFTPLHSTGASPGVLSAGDRPFLAATEKKGSSGNAEVGGGYSIQGVKEFLVLP